MSKKLSYSDIILKWLESEPLRRFKSYELLKAETPFGWLGSSGDRAARKLAEKGFVFHVEHGESGYAEYWHKAQEFSFPASHYRPEVIKEKIQNKLI